MISHPPTAAETSTECSPVHCNEVDDLINGQNYIGKETTQVNNTSRKYNDVEHNINKCTNITNEVQNNEDVQNINNKPVHVITKCSLADDNETDTNADKHGNGEFMCIDCGDILCAMCRKAHDYTRLTRHHTIKKLSEYNKAVDSTQQQEHDTTIICSFHHNEPIKFYCKYCLEIICAICYDENHRNHKVIGLEEANEDLSTFIANGKLKDENDRVKYIAEIEKLRSLQVKTQEVTDPEVKKTFLDQAISLKAMCDEIITRYEFIGNDILLTIRKKSTEIFEDEIAKFEKKLNKINSRIFRSSLILNKTSSVVNRAELVKQIKTEPITFDNSQLLKENVLDYLNATARFIKPEVEFKKTNQKISEYSLLSFGSKIKLSTSKFNTQLPTTSFSAFEGQLLISNDKQNILIQNNINKVLKNLENEHKAVLCGSYVAAISTVNVHSSKIRLFSITGSCIETVQNINSSQEMSIIKINYANGELLIIAPSKIFIAKLPSIEQRTFSAILLLQEDTQLIGPYVHAIDATSKTDTINLYHDNYPFVNIYYIL